VTYLADRERRRYERFPQVLDVHARCLLSAQAPANGPQKEFDGRLHNLSNGGICILSSSPLQPSTFLCCSFPVFEAPVAVPALMQVKWTVKRGQKSPNYISGLEFVI